MLLNGLIILVDVFYEHYTCYSSIYNIAIQD